MAKKWSEVIESKEFKSLDSQEQELARIQYFNEVVAPQISEDEVRFARDQFDSETTISTITNRPVNEEPKTPFVETAKAVGYDLKENWPVYLGAGIGGAMGGIPGATIGGAAGESYKQIGQHITGSGEAPKTSGEALWRMGKQGATMGAYEVGGKAIIWGGNKLLNPFKSKVTPEGRIAREVLDKYMPIEKSWSRPISKFLKLKKPGALPAEATEHYGLDLMNNIAEKSWAGGVKIADYKNIVRKEAIEDLTDDLANSFGRVSSSSDLGSLIADTVILKFDNFKKHLTDPMYKTLYRMLKPAPKVGIQAGMQEGAEDVVKFSLRPLKQFAKGNMDVIDQIGSVGGKNAGDDIIRAILNTPDNVDFRVANELRSRLLNEIDEFRVTNPNAKAIGKSKTLISKLDDEISSVLQAKNKDAYRLWRDVNALYSKGYEKYNNDFLRKLIKQANPRFGNEPEKVLGMIFKKGGESTVKNVKNAVGDDVFNQLKAWHIQELIAKSVKNDIIQGETLYKKMFGSSGFGSDAMNAIYSPSEITSLKRVASALQTVQAKQAQGGGGMLIQLMQASAIVPLTLGIVRPLSAAIMIGPEVLSRMMLNPISSKWLSEGLMTIPKSMGTVTANALRATKFIEQFSEPAFSELEEKEIIKQFRGQ